jgi:hypothetical protein
MSARRLLVPAVAFAIGVALISSSEPRAADEPPAPAGWKLTWSDEFDGKEIDKTKWDFDLGNGFLRRPLYLDLGEPPGERSGMDGHVLTIQELGGLALVAVAQFERVQDVLVARSSFLGRRDRADDLSEVGVGDQSVPRGLVQLVRVPNRRKSSWDLQRPSSSCKT